MRVGEGERLGLAAGLGGDLTVDLHDGHAPIATAGGRADVDPAVGGCAPGDAQTVDAGVGVASDVRRASEAGERADGVAVDGDGHGPRVDLDFDDGMGLRRCRRRDEGSCGQCHEGRQGCSYHDGLSFQPCMVQAAIVWRRGSAATDGATKSLAFRLELLYNEDVATRHAYISSSTNERHLMTELIWDGKYDANGKKVAPLRIALPFQTVETVNESAADRHRTLDMFSAGKPAEWRNRLIRVDSRSSECLY